MSRRNKINTVNVEWLNLAELRICWNRIDNAGIGLTGLKYAGICWKWLELAGIEELLNRGTWEVLLRSGTASSPGLVLFEEKSLC